MTDRKAMLELVRAFTAANDRSPVVSGEALHSGGEGPDFVVGVRYTLANRSLYCLSSEASRLLPEGYPRWLL